MQEENTKNNIKTVSFGCRLNAMEAEKIQKMLADTIKTAILVNTCAVTAEAERQSGQSVRKFSRENPDAPIFVTGCAATRNPDLFFQIPNALVIKNQDKLNINAYIDAINNAPCHFNNPKITNFSHPAPQLSKQFIQVQNGCNHKCAYCVTRLLRETAVSFDYQDILNDAKAAINSGFQEIVLTGVDIASYAKDGLFISDVCKKLLSDLPEIKRLRLSSVDPASPEIFKIIDMIHKDSRMMPHLHLSMQSGSNTILNLMHRRHNANTIRKLVEAADKKITFSWDIICGFPGETEELFQETVSLTKETKPIKIHAFPFSPRPGTEAYDMPNKIDRSVSKKRVKIISELAENYRLDFMTSQLSKTVQVLVEENNTARTPNDISVKILGEPIKERTVCNVYLKDIQGDVFIGEKA